MSYFLAAGRAEVAHGDVHHPVGQPEGLDDLLLVREQFLMERG